MNFNPLRDVFARAIDFDAVNDANGLKVFLTATNVRSGRPKIFRRPGIQLDCVMASACLPFTFKAVEIDGEAHWDGGYMGNPALFPLVDECEPGDLRLIQINPFHRPDVPRSARDMRRRFRVRLNLFDFSRSTASMKPPARDIAERTADQHWPALQEAESPRERATTPSP